MAKKSKKLSDIEECQRKIRGILEEYNCGLVSADEYSNVLLWDKDTDEYTSAGKE